MLVLGFSGAVAQERALRIRSLEAATDLPPGDLPHAGSIYVPAYSSMLISGGNYRLDFSVTLSIHNTSRSQVLVLRSVDYHGTGGTLVEALLDRPLALKPLGTVDVFVETRDIRGGTGANFLVEWAAAAPISQPIAEAIMLGSTGTQGYSFVSVGRPN
jgi:hypothetical protein